MDNAPDYIYFKDRESRFIRISKSHAQSFGLSDPAQAVGKTDFDFFTEEHARPAYEDEQTIIQTGQPILNKEEKRNAARSSGCMGFNDQDADVRRWKHRGTFGMSKDVTERKRTEEALAYEQYLLNSLLDNAPYQIYFKDAEAVSSESTRLGPNSTIWTTPRKQSAKQTLILWQRKMPDRLLRMNR